MTVSEIERAFYLKNTPLPKYIVEMAEIGENSPSSVGDISAGFPDEGFLDGAIQSLDYLIKYTHKNNKLIPDLIKIREALSERQAEVMQAAEYGASELSKLKVSLGIR